MTDQEIQDGLKEAEEHRRKHWRCEINAHGHRMDHGRFSLDITTNGFQWQGIGLNDVEARKVIAALTEWLEANQ